MASGGTILLSGCSEPPTGDGIPLITGDYQPKHAGSKTPFDHRLGKLIK
ncbi:hypothetical protein [Spirosoma pomorum]